MAQFFGIMPVINMTDKTASKLRFELTAARTVISGFMLFCVGFFAFITLYIVIVENNFDRVSK